MPGRVGELPTITDAAMKSEVEAAACVSAGTAIQARQL
jgi:hypothetical protein